MDLPRSAVFDFLDAVVRWDYQGQIESVRRIFGDAAVGAFLGHCIARRSCASVAETTNREDAAVSPEAVIRLVLPFCDESRAPDAMEKVAAGLWNLYRRPLLHIGETFRILDSAVGNCLRNSMASDRSRFPDFENFARLTALRRLIVGICSFEIQQATSSKPRGNDDGPMFI